MRSRHAAESHISVNWSYVSGFFDGEGGISVSGRLGANALALKVTICQKSDEVLRKIKKFLSLAKIHSAIYVMPTGLNTLEIGRLDDLARFLRSVRVVVKRRQVATALAYLEGRVSGNTLIHVFDQECRLHKRKKSPLKNIGLRFPMTRLEAVRAAEIKAAEGRIRGIHLSFRKRVRQRALLLPRVFDVKDIQRVIGVSRTRSQLLARIMERHGLVKCRFEKVPPRFHKLVCERI